MLGVLNTSITWKIEESFLGEGSIAQGLEHWSCKPGVASSNLAGACWIFFPSEASKRQGPEDGANAAVLGRSHLCSAAPERMFKQNGRIVISLLLSRSGSTIAADKCLSAA